MVRPDEVSFRVQLTIAMPPTTRRPRAPVESWLAPPVLGTKLLLGVLGEDDEGVMDPVPDGAALPVPVLLPYGTGVVVFWYGCAGAI